MLWSTAVASCFIGPNQGGALSLSASAEWGWAACPAPQPLPGGGGRHEVDLETAEGAPPP